MLVVTGHRCHITTESARERASERERVREREFAQSILTPIRAEIALDSECGDGSETREGGFYCLFSIHIRPNPTRTPTPPPLSVTGGSNTQGRNKDCIYRKQRRRSRHYEQRHWQQPRRGIRERTASTARLALPPCVPSHVTAARRLALPGICHGEFK